MRLKGILRMLAGCCVLLVAGLLRFYGQDHGWSNWVIFPVFVGLLVIAIGLLSWEKHQKKRSKPS